MQMQQSGANPAELSPAEAGRILTECRNAFSAETTPIADRFFATVDKLLESQLLVELNGDARKDLLAAQTACREKKTLIAMRFRDCFLKVYEKTLAGRDTDAGLENDFAELTLVGDDVIEEDLVARHVEWLITDICAEELKVLDRRMPLLMGNDEATHHPLSPRCVVRALRDACMEVITDAPLRLHLFTCVDAEVAQAFQPAYKTASEYIASRVPEPRMKAVKKSSTTRPAAGGGEQVPVAGGAAAGQAQSYAPMQGQPLSLAGNNASGNVAPVSHELLAKLDRLIERHQERHPELASAPPPQINASSGVSVDLESLLQRFAASTPVESLQASTHNLIRDIKSDAADATLPAAESIIIDVIAMMFDYIFDDEEISAPIKGVVGRLQMHVLKIALADKTFFSNKYHPARQLVDRLAELAGECAQDSPEEARLFNEANRIADEIQAAPEASIPAFESALESLEAFTRPEEESSREEALRISRSVTQAEESTQRKRVIRHGLAEKIAGQSLPMSVSRFVLNQWVDYISILKEKQTEPARFKTLDDSLNDLLWSVTPKHSAGELALLTRRIPVIIEAVNVCLETVNAFPHERQAILEALRTAHLNNLKTKSPAEAAAAAAAETAPKPEAPAPVVPEEEEPELPALPQELLKGAMLDFQQDGKTVRAKLNWISPSRAKFVFTSQAMPAFGLSAAELAEELEAKRATIVKQGNAAIMERVVEKAIQAAEK